jgi:5'(3')-deoxyribonucleotidase
MPKPIIAVDIDDVLAQGTESLRVEVNERLGVSLTTKHYSVPGEYWGYYERVWEKNGLSGLISMEELNPRMVEDQSHIPPFKQAHEVLRKLAMRFQLVVVTARKAEWERATRYWLEVHFPHTFTNIYFAGRRTEKQTKGDLCKELGAEWLIDDNVLHAQSALDCGTKVILFGNYGWHQKVNIHNDIIRCKDWDEVNEYFDGIS